MQNFKKIMTVINFFIAAMILWIFIDFLNMGDNNGWGALALLLISIVFAIATIILTIPFIIVLTKEKFGNMKLYFFSHLLLVLETIGVVAYAFLLA